MRLAGICLILGLLAGCGGADESPAAQDPPKKTVFDPMTSQVERVQKRADELPQERKDNLDAAIDSTSQ